MSSSSSCCHRHHILDTGGSTELGQKYTQIFNHQINVLSSLVKGGPVGSGFNNGGGGGGGGRRRRLIPAHVSVDKVISQDLETRSVLVLEADKLREEEEWVAMIAALKGDTQLKGIQIVSDVTGKDAKLAYDQQLEEKQRSAKAALTSTTKKSISGASSSLSSLAANKRNQVERKSNSILLHSRISNTLLSSITSSLMVNRNITMLELNGFPLTEKALYFLNKGLEHNQSITHLALARTAIGDDGVAELAHGIRVHPTLSCINLSACKLTARSAAILSDILKSQAIQRQSEQWATTLRIHRKKELERLKLSSSTTPVATATSVGVIYKNTLKRLNLSCNLLGNDGCEVFVDALKEEIGLRALDLQSNSINDAGGRMIEQMLRINTDLVIVDLRNNSLDEILLKVVDIQLARNMETYLSVALGKDGYDKHDLKTTLKSVDTDLFWLDAIDPLKSTYLVYPHDFRHRHHTMSSVNKQVMVYQKQHSYLDRQARMDAKKLPQKSNSESGRASSIASSSKQLPNVKVVDTRRKLLKASQSLQKSLSSNADGLVTKKLTTPRKRSKSPTKKKRKSPTKVSNNNIMLVHAGDAARAASASSSPHRRTNAWGEAFNFDQINNSIAAVPKVEWEVAVEEQSKNNYRDVISTNYIDSAIENIKRVAAGGGAEEDSGGGGDNIYANYSPKNYRKQLAKDQEWAFRKRDSSYNDCYYEQQQHMNTNDYIEDRKWRRTVNEPVSSPPRDAADLLAESHSEYQQQSQKQQQEQQFTSWEKEREWIKSVARDLQGGKFDGRSDILSSQPVPPQQQQNLMAAVSTSKSSQGGAGSSSFNMDKLASILGMFETSLFTFHKLIDKIEEKEVRVKV